MSSNKYIKLPVEDPRFPRKVTFTKSHLKGFFKLGRVVIPEKSDFPSFQDIDPEKYLNRMLDYMYKDDLAAILIILQLFSIMPLFMIRWIMSLVETGSRWGGMIGAPFRMLQIALKGLIFTIYYSDFTTDGVIHSRIGYDAKIVM